MEIVVHQGESADGTPLDADDVLDVKNPAQATNKLVATLNEYGRRLRELEKPSGSQLTQAIQKVLDISANIDNTVAASINRNSYDRATIDQKCNTWNWGVLSTDRGGTNTTNAYNNLFTIGPWRAVWALSDGTMGTSQSQPQGEAGFPQAGHHVGADAFRGLDALPFHRRREPERRQRDNPCRHDCRRVGR